MRRSRSRPLRPRPRVATTAVLDSAPEAAALMDTATAHSPDRAAVDTFVGQLVRRRIRAGTDHSFICSPEMCQRNWLSTVTGRALVGRLAHCQRVLPG